METDEGSRSREGFPVRALNVSMAYPVGESLVSVLRNVTLEVPPGQFLAVMGPSGSGKSTLLHLLAGLQRPTSGELWVGDNRIDRLSPNEAARWRRLNVGTVHQFFNLIPSLNVVHNVALPLLFEGHRLNSLREKIDALLERLNIAHRRDHELDQLSGGELQRVAIARALLPGPGLLLADEPTGNLDSKTGHEILALFKETCSERGATAILVTHDLQTVSYSDRVVVIRDGQIEQDDGSLLGNR